MKWITRILPWALLALFLTEIVAVFMPKSENGFHVQQFGSLPVLLNGRVQPFDSVGRNALLQLRSTGDVALEVVPGWKFWHHPKKLKSTEWLLEVMINQEQADDRPAFLIHHPELLRTLKLDEIGLENSGLRYYTYRQIAPVRREILDLAMQFNDIDDKLRTPYQQQLMKLHSALNLYERLQLTLQPIGTEDLAAQLAEFQVLAPAGAAAMRSRDAGQPYDTNAFVRFAGVANDFLQVANAAMPMTIPPNDPKLPRDQWVNFGNGAMDAVRDGQMHPAVQSLATIASAYRKGDVEGFNQAVDGYRQWLDKNFTPEAKKGRAEFYFNRTQGFLHAMIIYMAAFFLAAGALIMFALAPQWAESFRRSAVLLIALAFVVHTFTLIFRMALEGRPPVTNLYSSAVFIGWGAVIMGLLLEMFFRVGLGGAVAALAGFVTLIIAHNLGITATNGDTMQMMQAVLDTNFWLSTHVTTVTIGYASTFVAGTLGIAYVFLGLLTPMLRQPLGGPGKRPPAPVAKAHRGRFEVGGGIFGRIVRFGRKLKEISDRVAARESRTLVGAALVKMIYAIVCFATLFSFVGTVLGGIWADQSWGRFWGWDPKENGALIIVLWNALILHARWGGLVRERGLAVMVIVGNIVTSYSWFGVNMLGIGLHSYGFTDAAFKWLLLFIISQLAIIFLGCLPAGMWRSFRGGGTPSSTKPGKDPAGTAEPRMAS